MNLEKYNQDVVKDLQRKKIINYKERLGFDTQLFFIKAYFFKVLYFLILFMLIFIDVSIKNNSFSFEIIENSIIYYFKFFYESLYVQSLSFFLFGLLGGFFAKRIYSVEQELMKENRLKNQNLAILYFFSSILILVYSIVFGFLMEHVYLSFAEDNYKLSNEPFLNEMGKNNNLLNGYVLGLSNAIIYFKLLTDHYYKSMKIRSKML